MDPDQFYCYPTAGDDGMIYCAIQFEKMDIVVFDPKKRQSFRSLHRVTARLSVCDSSRVKMEKSISNA